MKRTVLGQNHLERHVIVGEMLGFLAAPAEDEGVPAFEADDPSPRVSQPEQQVVDFVLPQMVPSCFLAGEDAAGPRRNEVLDLLADEAVEHHHIGLAHQPQSLDCQEIGVARPGSYQIYTSLAHRSSPCQRLS